MLREAKGGAGSSRSGLGAWMQGRCAKLSVSGAWSFRPFPPLAWHNCLAPWHVGPTGTGNAAHAPKQRIYHPPEARDVLDKAEQHVGVQRALVRLVDHHHAEAGEGRGEAWQGQGRVERRALCEGARVW